MPDSVAYWVCSCGTANLNAQSHCSACRNRRPRSKRLYALGAVAVIIVLAALLPKPDDIANDGANLSEAQETFLKAISQAEAVILATPNALAANRALSARETDLSHRSDVSRWRGRVLGVQQMQGKGAISVEVGGAELVAGVFLSLGLDTLVSPDDQPLFGQFSKLRAGDIIEVSGKFVVHQGALVELSYSGSGSVSSPRFLFDFSEIALADK